MQFEISNKITNKTIELKENITQQSECKRDLCCFEIPYNEFMINRSFNDGNAMFRNVARIALDAFDAYCDIQINKITLSNISNITIKIRNKYDKINNQLSIFNITLKEEYLTLKTQQCQIQEEILFYKQQQKEIERTEREIIKEQLKEEKQLQKAQEKLEKEKVALQYKYNKEFEQTGIKNGNIQRDIEQLENKIEQNNYALTHKRAGYVYVVSNDDMKEGQYKIGITRRSVEERMNELGTGASHSFPMNIHGYVYCDDCFAVESALHKYFADNRVNQVNPRKEWFKTSLTEIRKAFKELFDIDIILTEVSNENYLYSKDKINI